MYDGWMGVLHVKEFLERVMSKLPQFNPNVVGWCLARNWCFVFDDLLVENFIPLRHNGGQKWLEVPVYFDGARPDTGRGNCADRARINKLQLPPALEALEKYALSSWK